MTAKIDGIEEPELRYLRDVKSMSQQAITDYFGVSHTTIQNRMIDFGMASTTEEERKEANREAQKRYRESNKGRETWKMYTQSEKGKERVKRYDQSEKGKETTKRYNQSDKGKERLKRFFQTDKGKKARERYEESDKSKERLKRYTQSEKGKETIKRYQQSDKGKAVISKRHSKRRQLGFIPFNKYFEGSAAHHIDFDHVIYIPEEIHKSIPHNIWTGAGMVEINKEAMDFLE